MEVETSNIYECYVMFDELGRALVRFHIHCNSVATPLQEYLLTNFQVIIKNGFQNFNENLELDIQTRKIHHIRELWRGLVLKYSKFESRNRIKIPETEFLQLLNDIGRSHTKLVLKVSTIIIDRFPTIKNKIQILASIENLDIARSSDDDDDCVSNEYVRQPRITVRPVRELLAGDVEFPIWRQEYVNSNYGNMQSGRSSPIQSIDNPYVRSIRKEQTSSAENVNDQSSSTETIFKPIDWWTQNLQSSSSPTVDSNRNSLKNYYETQYDSTGKLKSRPVTNNSSLVGKLNDLSISQNKCPGGTDLNSFLKYTDDKDAKLKFLDRTKAMNASTSSNMPYCNYNIKENDWSDIQKLPTKSKGSVEFINKPDTTTNLEASKVLYIPKPINTTQNYAPSFSKMPYTQPIHKPYLASKVPNVPINTYQRSNSSLDINAFPATNNNGGDYMQFAGQQTRPLFYRNQTPHNSYGLSAGAPNLTPTQTLNNLSTPTSLEHQFTPLNLPNYTQTTTTANGIIQANSTFVVPDRDNNNNNVDKNAESDSDMQDQLINDMIVWNEIKSTLVWSDTTDDEDDHGIFPKSANYFLIKPLLIKNISIGMQQCLWNFAPQTEKKLFRLFTKGHTVILIFSARGSNEFQGVAKLQSTNGGIPNQPCRIEWLSKNTLHYNEVRFFIHPKLHLSDDGQEFESCVGQQLCICIQDAVTSEVPSYSRAVRGRITPT